MGTADVIPGVSGGTIAFITGIYDTLINSLSDVGWKHLRSLPGLFIPKKSRASWGTVMSLNWGFLLPLFLGIVVAILTMARVIPGLMSEYPVATYGLFFGLILCSIRVPYREMKKNKGAFLILILFGLFSFAVLGPFGPLPGSSQPLWVFLSGAVAVCALILPGISGSYILVVLGQYSLILSSVNERNFSIVGLFILGMVTGILSFVHLLKFLLKDYRSVTMAALTGIMLGSLRVIWPPQHAPSGMAAEIMWLQAILFIIVGAALVLLLERLSPALNISHKTM